MFNWIYLQKFLIVCGIGAFSYAPIYLIKFSGDEAPVDQVSSLKQEYIKNPTLEIYGGKKYTDFVGGLLNSKEASVSLKSNFIKDISHSWIKHQASKSQYSSYLDEEREEHKKLIDPITKSKLSAQLRIYDEHGGSRAAMKDRFLQDKAYTYLKDLLTRYEPQNFTINKDYSGDEDFKTDKYFVEEQNYISKTELEKPENWAKIGFYPSKTSTFHNLSTEEKKFLRGKFHFLNWAYKHWYSQTLPFYTSMVLWKHATDGKLLASKFKAAELKPKGDKTTAVNLPSTPNYFFPAFVEEDGTDGSKEVKKFTGFVKDISKFNDEINFIPRTHTDDSATSIFVSSINSHDALYVEFASAANYLFGQAVNHEDDDFYSCICGDSKVVAPAVTDAAVPPPKADDASTNKLSEIETEKLTALKNPLDIFLLKPDTAAASETLAPGTIWIDPAIFEGAGAGGVGGGAAAGAGGASTDEKGSHKTNYTLHEARQVKDSPWLFLRNTAGVHAIMIDGYKYITKTAHGTCKIKKAFEHFNFRNLQLIHKQQLSLNNTLDVGDNDGLRNFKQYIQANYDSLLTNYFLNKSESKEYLFHNIPKAKLSYLQVFTDYLNSVLNIDFYQHKKDSRHSIRSKIISNYSGRNWVQDSTTTKNITVEKSSGLAGAFPYTFDNTEGKPIFPHQEWFLDKIDLNKKPKAAAQASKVSAVVQKADVSAADPSPEPAAVVEKITAETLIAKRKAAAIQLVKDLHLTIDMKLGNFFESDRLFSTNGLINSVIDEMINDGQFINALLKENFLKHQGASYFQQSLFKAPSFNKETLFTEPTTNTAQTTSTKKTSVFDQVAKNENLAQMLVKNYYASHLFSQSRGWFDPLAYKQYQNPTTSTDSGTGAGSTPTMNASAKNVLDFIISNAEEVYKEKFYFQTKPQEDQYYSQLIKLNYLIKNDLENLRRYLQKTIHNGGDAFFMFNKNELTFTSDTTSKQKHLYSNPFLNNLDKGATADTDKYAFSTAPEFAKLLTYIQSINIKTPSSGGTGVSATGTSTDLYNYAGVAVRYPVSSGNKGHSESGEVNTVKNLYAFGSRENMIKYISNIESTAHLNQFITWLKKKCEGLDLSSVEAANVSISDTATTGGTSSTPIVKTLYLNDRKNALISIVCNRTLANPSSITKAEAKSFYGWNTDDGKYVEVSKSITKLTDSECPTSGQPADTLVCACTSTVSVGGASSKICIKDCAFTKKTVKEDATSKQYVYQFNHEDISTTEKFKTFVDANLNEEMLYSIIFSIVASNEINQIATEDFFDSLAKVDVYDQKLKDALNAGFLKN